MISLVPSEVQPRGWYRVLAFTPPLLAVLLAMSGWPRTVFAPALSETGMLL